MMLLMTPLLPAVALLDRDFKKLRETGSRFVAARGVEGNTGATPAFAAVSRHKCLFLAPVVAAGVAPFRACRIIYEFATRRGWIEYMKPQGRDRNGLLSTVLYRFDALLKFIQEPFRNPKSVRSHR